MTAQSNFLKKQAWIHSPLIDLVFIIGPAFLITSLVLLFGNTLNKITEMPLWFWVVFIIGIDVAHVYSTLFRSYLNQQEFEKRKTLFTLVPLGCWLLGVLLYSFGELVFWRALAYLAVFHFVRQQYGFMAIYSKNEQAAFKRFAWLDSAVISLCMLYPLAYWHTHLPRNFSWFVSGDFVSLKAIPLDTIALSVFVLAALAYGVKEIVLGFKYAHFNLPKNLLILSTAFSWIIGIMFFNNDLVFTATNVVSHGIPYIALIWLVGRHQAKHQDETFLFSKVSYKSAFAILALPVFILFLWLIAYLEEGVWAGFVWHEHLQVFGVFSTLPIIKDVSALTCLVPLLALPQATHYVLDAFIWRFNPQDKDWTSMLKPAKEI